MEILRGINSDSIDLIYLDPPFNKGRQFHAPIGTTAEGASFHDIWSENEVKTSWHNQLNEKFPQLYGYLNAVGQVGGRSMKYYLIYMAVRLIEMHRVLTPTGSIYLHCDPTASHYLKLLMDTIWGHENMRNELVWRIGWVSGFKTKKVGFIRNHDTLLYYVKDTKRFTFNKEYLPYPPGYTRRDGKKPTGKGIPLEDTWNCSSGDVLDSIMIKSFSSEKTGYPTQKSLALLERVIKASSNKDGWVLDPFCGCATTCVAAERLDRKWVGIDVSVEAHIQVMRRLDPEVMSLYGRPILRKDIPKRTDLPHKKKPTPEDKNWLYGKQGGHCAGCKVLFDKRNLEIDHIVPASQGGSHELENLQLLCGGCNRLKGNRPMEYLKRRLKVYLMAA